jgi:trimethylamine--corrinoid protein Co-methyltransferase
MNPVSGNAPGATSTRSPGRRRSGGREKLRASRKSGGPPRIIPGIKRRIPTYELLDETALGRIEETADIILAEVGMEFRGDPEVLDLWRQAGARLEGERVRFEPGMLRELIQRSVPREFVQHARNPQRSVTFGGDNMVFLPAYGSPFVFDIDQGRRYATIEDFRNFVKLAYATPYLHHSGGTLCEPVDLPVNKRHLEMVYSHLRFSDKPLMGSVTAAERAEDSVELCRLVFGREFVDQNCVLVNIINTNSPLVFDQTMLAALKVYARANQCAIVTPFILGGAMGPVTLAGAVAQVLAEGMTGIALTQLLRPGAPVVLGTFTSSMSLRSGAPTFGMPEPALGYLAVGQLARRLGVPLRGGGCLTTSKLPDAQAAQESADTLMPSVLAGINMVMHCAGWLEGGLAMGYEKFMLDVDHLGMMHVFAEGLDLSDNGLALDAFREVPPGNHFLGCAHTMANYETAFYHPQLSDNDSFEQWREAGSCDAAARANALWKRILDDYQPPPIEPAVDEALRDYIERRKAAMPDEYR